MTSDSYDGSKIPPQMRRDQIGVTAEWWAEHRDKYTAEERKYLNSIVCGQSICPQVNYVRSTPESRMLLIQRPSEWQAKPQLSAIRQAQLDRRALEILQEHDGMIPQEEIQPLNQLELEHMIESIAVLRAQREERK